MTDHYPDKTGKRMSGWNRLPLPPHKHCSMCGEAYEGESHVCEVK